MPIVYRPRLRTPVFLARSGAMLIFLAALPTASAQWRTFFVLPVPATQPAAGADPLPLRRLLITPERVPIELERARQGALVQMTRAEFEARVAEATRASEALKNLPRLLEARYRATLVDTALVGTGQWTVINPGSAAGILPLQPLNLALRQARLDDTEAILGDLDGKSLGLLVERPGKQTATLEWSARADPRPEGLHFELKVPSCVLTSFDLELPADRPAPLVGDNCFLSGPRAAAAPDRQIWRLQVAGSSPVDLVIRRAAVANEPAPLVLASLLTTQKLSPDLVEADFDFSLDVMHGSVRELVCEGDPALQPTSVSIHNAAIETWEVRAGGTPGAPLTLRIRLREPFQGTLSPLHIHCVTPAFSKSNWTSPGLRLRGAVLLGETISLRVSPEVRLEDWQAGGFELTKAAIGLNGWQTLTLQSGLGGAPESASNERQGARAAPRRPSARVQVQELEYRARQFSWWQIGSDSTSLTVQIDYEVVRGRLFRLPVVLPADWSPDRIGLNPTELLRNWTPMPPERGRTLLIVELQRPLETSKTARLTFRLRPVNPWPPPQRGDTAKPAELREAFPEVIPQGARLWDGLLAIRVDPLYQATVKVSLPAGASERTEDRGSRVEHREELRSDASGPPSSILYPLPSTVYPPSPWGTQPPDYLYAFRGQAVTGTLQLRPRSPRVRAHCTSEVVLTAGRAAVLTRLVLQPEVGTPDSVDLLVSAPVSGVWQWRSEGGRNAVKGMQRLATAGIVAPLLTLGAGMPLEAVSLLLAPAGRGTWWRLTLAQPLREPLILETTFDLVGQGPAVDAASRLTPLAADKMLAAVTLAATAVDVRTGPTRGRGWQVPLVAVLSADPMEGEVRLYLVGGSLVQVEADGLREMAASSAAGASIPWRTFRYTRPPVSLVLHGRVAALDRPEAARVDRAHLTTYVEPEGRLLNYYSFQIHNWKQRNLPLRLPAGARLLAAKVDGRWIALPTQHDAADNTRIVLLPVAATETSLCLEIVYALEHPAGMLWTHVHAPAPVLPVTTIAFRRTWCLPADWVPLHEGRFLRHPGPASSATVWAEVGGRFPSLPAFSVPFSSAEQSLRQQRLLAEADAPVRVRRQEQKSWSLGEELHYLAYEFFKGQDALVLDARALREAGLRPTTPIKEDGPNEKSRRTATEDESPLRSLESLGLVCVPGRPALLLTTRRQLGAWQSALGKTHPLSESVELAVSEAMVHGHDRSGRFQSVADWLRSRDAECASQQAGESKQGAGESAVPDSSYFLPHPESWTEWQPITGQAGEEALVVLRKENLSGAAYSVTGALLLAWWWARRQAARLRYGFLLFWLAASGLAVLWLPAALCGVFWWPMLAGITLALAWYLVSALRSHTGAPSREPSAAAVALLVLTLTAGLPGQAAAPGSHTVLLLPGPADAPEKLTALVPPELLEQLQALARRGARGLQGAVLVSAKYHGTVANGTADFQAEFRVHSFAEETTTLALPLGGVELQEALLDGTAAYPLALAPPQNGYAVRIKGRGAHTVRARFTIHLPSAGDDQDLRFSIPELTQSQLTLLVPHGARYLQAVFCRGAQQVTADPKGVRLDADLGHVGTLQVYWRQEARQPPPATVQVEEVYFWDVQASVSRLLVLLDYTVIRGAVTDLTIGLPERMEVRHVVMVSPTGGGVQPRLKEWLVTGTGAGRRVRLEFQGPVTKNVQVRLELVPSLPLGSSAALSLPTPEGVTPAESFLAYRVKGLEASVEAQAGLTDIEPAVFERHWQPAGNDYAGRPEQAYRFQRTPGAAPLLRLDLHTPATRAEGIQDLTWRLAPQQAELRAKAKLTAVKEDLVFIEWEIPVEVRVSDVRGEDVRNWSRTASRLQVWLQRSVPETTLELAGWVPRPAAKPTAPFALPCLYFPAAAPHPTFVRVVAEKGWALHAEARQNLWPLPESRSSNQDLNYLAKQTAYRGTFHIRLASAKRLPPQLPVGGVAPPGPSAGPAGPVGLVDSRPVQILSQEQAAAMVDGRRWLHQGTYWLYQASGTHLGVLLPNGATLVRTWLDGKEVTPPQPNAEQLLLPLTGSSRLRTLRLSWTFDTDTEPLEQPQLEEPRLENAVLPPPEQRRATLWVVHIPPGYRLTHADGNALRASPVERDLHRASVQLLSSGMLAEQATAKADDPQGRQLLAAQQRFFRYWREAEYWLTLPERVRDASPSDQSLAARLEQLRTDNNQLSQKHHFENIRLQAETQENSRPPAGISRDMDDVGNDRFGETDGDLLAKQGTPTYWQTAGENSPPRLQLAAVQAQQTQQALGYSGLLLVLFLIAWILPNFPRVVAWVRAFWPEQLVVLGGLGWLMLGENLVFAFLVLLGILARLLHLAQYVVALLRRPAPPAAAGSGGTSAT